MELLLDPDVETVVIDYLNEWLPLLSGETAQASDTRKDARCVRVIQTGGSGRVSHVLSKVQITLDSYDANPYDAGELARRGAALIMNLRSTEYGGIKFANVETFATAANLPDPQTERERYTQTFVLTVHLGTVVF